MLVTRSRSADERERTETFVNGVQQGPGCESNGERRFTSFRCETSMQARWSNLWKSVLGKTNARHARRERDAWASSRGRTGPENGEIRRLPKEKNSEQWAACFTLSQTYGTGYSPVPQHPTRLKMHNEFSSGLQTAATLSKWERFDGSRSKSHGESKLRVGNVVNARRSKANVDSKIKTTTASSRQQKRVGYQYPLVTVPKAPDEEARRVDDRQDDEARNAPRPGRNSRAGGQSRWGEQSLLMRRDTSHTSHEAMRLRIASSNNNRTGSAVGTSSRWQDMRPPIGGWNFIFYFHFCFLVDEVVNGVHFFSVCGTLNFNFIHQLLEAYCLQLILSLNFPLV